MEHIPTDRIIDGIDQTSLLLNGDSHGRRVYVHIHAGPNLGATVKDHHKMHWISADPSQASSGITAAYDLLNDHREINPMVTNMLHFKEPFMRMRARHNLWIRKNPNMPSATGPAYTDIVNARPETRALLNPPVIFEDLPLHYSKPAFRLAPDRAKPERRAEVHRSAIRVAPLDGADARRPGTTSHPGAGTWCGSNSRSSH